MTNALFSLFTPVRTQNFGLSTRTAKRTLTSNFKRLFRSQFASKLDRSLTSPEKTLSRDVNILTEGPREVPSREVRLTVETPKPSIPSSPRPPITPAITTVETPKPSIPSSPRPPITPAITIVKPTPAQLTYKGSLPTITKTSTSRLLKALHTSIASINLKKFNLAS